MGDILFAVGAINREIAMEKWKTHPVIKSVEVSDLGKVRNSTTKQIYKQGIDKYGYNKLSLGSSNNRVYKTVHRLVMETWTGSVPEGLQVNHINGVKTDNRLCNLEWVTPSYNINHSYRTGLNNNVVMARLIDVKDNKEIKNLPLKSISRMLGVRFNVLIPLILNSGVNHILGRYVIIVNNEDDIGASFNSLNFGRQVFCKEMLSGEITLYSSMMSAAFFTGVRSMRELHKKDPYLVIGYAFSFNKDNLVGYTVSEQYLSLISSERYEYLNKPYLAHNKNGYLLYDYYLKTQYHFQTLDGVKSFIEDKRQCTGELTSSAVNSAMFRVSRNGKTGLIRGYGCKPATDSTEWTNHNEEIILCSLIGLKAPVRVFRVKTKEEDIICYGYKDLLSVIGISVDGHENEKTLKKIIADFKSTDIRFERLDFPIN